MAKVGYKQQLGLYQENTRMDLNRWQKTKAVAGSILFRGNIVLG
jgi:hypothetical protein